MVSGGHSVSTLPPPTLKLRPLVRHRYITASASAATGNFHTERHTQPAHRGSRAHVHAPQPLQPICAQLARPLQQALVPDHVQRRQRRRAADRALLVRVVPERAVGRDIQILARDQRRHREHAAAQPLAQHQHVRHAAQLLAREHRAGASQAARDLVEDQQRAVPVAARAHARPEIRRRRLQGCPAHRLRDHRADVALHLQHVVDVVRQPLMRAPVAAEEARRQRRRRHMLGARQQRAGVAAEDRLAADRDRIERGAVERIPHRYRLVPARRMPRQLQRHADRRCAARREQHLVQPPGRQLRQPPRQFDRRRGWCSGAARTAASPVAASPPRSRADGRSRPGARCCRGNP